MSSGLRRLATGLMAPLRAYNEVAKRAPFSTGIVTTVLKTSAADFFAQRVIEGKEDIDWKRNAVFSIFGFAYLGCWQYHLYNNLFTRLSPTIASVLGSRAVAPVLTFLDQCVHHPILYFPVFYLLRGSMHGEPAAESMSKYSHDLWDNLKALWMVWVPSQLVNFSVVPLHLRIPFVAGVSFAWTVILSVLRGALHPATTAQELAHAGAQAVSDAVHGVQGVTTAFADDGRSAGTSADSEHHATCSTGGGTVTPGLPAVASTLVCAPVSAAAA